MGCSSKLRFGQPIVPSTTATERSQGTTQVAFFFSLLAHLLALSSLILRYAADKMLGCGFFFSYKPFSLLSVLKVLW